ncbi:MAG TPA: hypothetical protein VGM36_00025 [Rhizomicrobium sp.]
MTLQAAIVWGIKISIMLNVLAMGMNFTMRGAAYLARHPRKLARSLFAMDIVMPAFAIAVAALFPIPIPAKIALVALSLSPTPPILPQRTVKTGGSEAYIMGLLVAAAVVALFFVPLAMELIGVVSGIGTHMPITAVAFVLGMTIFVPLTTGILIRLIWPGGADVLAKPVGIFAMILLVVCAVALLAGGAWRGVLAQIHDGEALAFAAFVLFGLAVGHLLGGPEPSDRTVLALATGARHPGLALAIATLNFPAQKSATAAIILYLAVSAIVSLPYAMWRKRQIPDNQELAAAIRQREPMRSAHIDSTKSF